MQIKFELVLVQEREALEETANTTHAHEFLKLYTVH
jgi:hypothetical protein